MELSWLWPSEENDVHDLCFDTKILIILLLMFRGWAAQLTFPPYLILTMCLRKKI